MRKDRAKHFRRSRSVMFERWSADLERLDGRQTRERTTGAGLPASRIALSATSSLTSINCLGLRRSTSVIF